MINPYEFKQFLTYILMFVQLRKRPFVRWKAVRVPWCSRHVFNLPGLCHCVTVLARIVKCNVDHLENAGVWIDMAMSYQGPRRKHSLTVA